MLDYLNLPTVPGRDVQVFTLPSTVTNLQWSTWTKPRGLSMAHILCMGSGSAGGSGWGAAVGGAGGGGGAGASSGISRVTVPLEFLPDRLYIQVGAGGLGSANGAGGSGILSYVAIYPDTTATNVLCVSGAAVPTGGGAGTSAAVGAASVAATIAAITAMPLAGLGLFTLVAGMAGVAGGAVAGGVGGANAIANTSCIAAGGTGGGGKTSADFSGGLITVITTSYLYQYAPATAVGTNLLNNGSGGTQLWKPFYSFGGMGGGATNAAGGVGGAGGIGAYGAGGGGGGAGLTGGRGGDGGSGIVIISCF
jgi:hypothetical protein